MREEFIELSTCLNKLNKNTGWNKYNLCLYKGEERVGYLAFLLSQKDKKASFRGIYVKEKFRRKGFSNLLFQNFFNYCNYCKINNIHTNKQKKPLSILILQNYGFKPINIKESQNVRIGFENDSIYLDFNNKKLETKFFNSTISKTNNYKKIDEFKDINLPYEIKINSGYAL